MADIGKALDAVVKTAAKAGESGIFGSLAKQHSDSYKGLSPSRTSVTEGADPFKPQTTHLASSSKGKAPSPNDLT
tara:strand:+ start:191 stop:415 length:225 start_codon:yes stop_codon:yes gene_type:complete